MSINSSQKENEKSTRENEKERDEITTEEAHFAVEDDYDNVVVKVDGESRDSHMYQQKQESQSHGFYIIR